MRRKKGIRMRIGVIDMLDFEDVTPRKKEQEESQAEAFWIPVGVPLTAFLPVIMLSTKEYPAPMLVPPAIPMIRQPTMNFAQPFFFFGAFFTCSS